MTNIYICATVQQRVTLMIHIKFGHPDIDLFGTQNNGKCNFVPKALLRLVEAKDFVMRFLPSH